MEKKIPALFFDSECPLCLRFKQTLEKSGQFSHLHYYDINDSQTFVLFEQINPEMAFSSLHLIDETGLIKEGPEAVKWLIDGHEKVKDWLWLIDNQMGKKAIDFFYNQTNKLRKQLKNNCLGCNNRRDHSL